jgi:plastocyanin
VRAATTAARATARVRGRLAAALLVLLAAPAAARAEEVQAGIAFAAFQPPDIQVLAGDTVTWINDSVRAHTVNADDGSWASPELVAADRFSHTFAAPGTVPFYCRLHAFMRGQVDVVRLLIDAPATPAASGRPYPLHGRTALPSGTPLTIEADTGSGYRAAASAQVAADGSFATSVTPSDSGSYRVVAGADASPPVTLTVLNRSIRAWAVRRKHRISVGTEVLPSSRGAVVVLQMHLKERFGWWPVRRHELDRFSQTRFVVTHRRAVALRVVLTLPDGATPLATSPVLRVTGLHRAKRPG